MTLLDNPKHWRNRAEEVRTKAKQTADPILGNTLLVSAKRYENLAERAEDDWGFWSRRRTGLPSSIRSALGTNSARGYYTGWLQTSPTLGIVVSLAVIIATRWYFGDEGFSAWAWPDGREVGADNLAPNAVAVQGRGTDHGSADDDPRHLGDAEGLVSLTLLFIALRA